MSDAQQVQVQAHWSANPFDVPRPVNQVMVQAGVSVNGGQSDEFVMTLGFLNPPVIAPGTTPEQLMQQLEGQTIPIIPVGQFALTRGRLVELKNLISQVLEESGGSDVA
ncbi:hypothetical protein [Pseudoclavibacter albus]|uniref:hypothetical protein n=1 Tax=Pseudoclavibacter albus TaxID=272241 RepID=UPI000AA40888|nr:hypothetical protein [Pseudoclavibacter alba]